MRHTSSKSYLFEVLNWRIQEFVNWIKLLFQDHGISNFEMDEISNNCTEYHRGIPHGKLLMVLQLRANVYPTREFFKRGRPETHIKSCWHYQAENEICLCIICYCPTAQNTRIKRHNQLREMLVDEGKNKDWVEFWEPLLKDEQNELYKVDLVIVKGDQDPILDNIGRYESKSTSLAKK